MKNMMTPKIMKSRTSRFLRAKVEAGTGELIAGDESISCSCEFSRPSYAFSRSLEGFLLVFCKLCRHNFEHYRDVPAFENNASIIGIFSKHYQTTSVHKVQTDRKQVIFTYLETKTERVFSLLSNSFTERQARCMEDYIETSVMLQYNHR